MKTHLRQIRIGTLIPTDVIGHREHAILDAIV